MALLRYLQPIDNVPDPKGPLSSGVARLDSTVHFNGHSIRVMTVLRALLSKLEFLQHLLPICPGKCGTHARTASRTLHHVSKFVVSVNRGGKFSWGQIFVGSLTHEN